MRIRKIRNNNTRSSTLRDRFSNGGGSSINGTNSVLGSKKRTRSVIGRIVTIVVVVVSVTVITLAILLTHKNNNSSNNGYVSYDSLLLMSEMILPHDVHQDPNSHGPPPNPLYGSSLPYSTTIVTSIFSSSSTTTDLQQQLASSDLLSIEDPMIIFVSPDLSTAVTNTRRRYDSTLERTRIVPVTNIQQQLPIFQQILPNLRLNLDQTAKEQTTLLLSKPWFLNEASTNIDPFQTKYFAYIDYNLFTNAGWFQETLQREQQQQQQKQVRIVTHPHPENIIPTLEVLFSACITTKDTKVRSKNKIEPWKDTSSNLFVHHSNSIMIGSKTPITKYYDAYMITIQKLSTNNHPDDILTPMFHTYDNTINDGAVTQTTCTDYSVACDHLVTGDVKSSSSLLLDSPTKCPSTPTLLLDALHPHDETTSKDGSTKDNYKLWTNTRGFVELDGTPLIFSSTNTNGLTENNSGAAQTMGSSSQSNNNPVPSKSSSVPSAKTLLTSPPPFKDTDLIKLGPNVELVQSPNTVVTGYFRIPSKFASSKYDTWMENMLSLQDAMIVFTEPQFVDQIKRFRQHAINRTVIVPMELNQLPYGTLFSSSFWEDQMNRNPEKKIHKSVELFWIWLSKTWCVTQAIRLNLYRSDFFVWSDIGCFRNKKYNGMTMIVHPESVPRNRIVQMAHHKPVGLDDPIFNDKYKQKNKFFHSGSQFAGYKDTMQRYHEIFLETIDIFLERNMIIVDDQLVAQSACLSHPDLCAYIPYTQVPDNAYFGLRYMLINGRKSINLWIPPSLR